MSRSGGGLDAAVDPSFFPGTGRNPSLMSDSMNILRGTLDALVLQALSGGPVHGYGIVDWIRETTDAVLEIEDGALYTALHRMEDRGWLRSEWGVSDRGRRAKFYALTAKGKRQLRRETAAWRRYAEAMGKVFAADPATG